MAELNAHIGKLLKDCGLDKSAVWKHKQSGRWIIYHWALERVAAEKGIRFGLPTVVETDLEKKLAVVLVQGTLGERTEWSFGEAAPYNTQQAYPFAMAEKRAKDRVALKLLSLHGEIYSEEEADDFKGGNGRVRDISAGAGSNPTEPPKLEMYTPWGEVEEEFEGPLAYLASLTMKVQDQGAYWLPNKHVVEHIGKHPMHDDNVKRQARKVWKLGEECWAQSPDNPKNKDASDDRAA